MTMTITHPVTLDLQGMRAATIAARGLDPAQYQLAELAELSFVPDPRTGTPVPSMHPEMFEFAIRAARRVDGDEDVERPAPAGRHAAPGSAVQELSPEAPAADDEPQPDDTDDQLRAEHRQVRSEDLFHAPASNGGNAGIHALATLADIPGLDGNAGAAGADGNADMTGNAGIDDILMPRRAQSGRRAKRGSGLSSSIDVSPWDVRAS